MKRSILMMGLVVAMFGPRENQAANINSLLKFCSKQKTDKQGAVDTGSVTYSNRISKMGIPEADLQFAKSRDLAPRGSAVITSSGNLAATKITAIIHAATGSMIERLDKSGLAEPTLDSLRNSLINSFELARVHKHKRIAIPFIGGGIFAKRMAAEIPEVALKIIRTTIENANGIEIVFTLFDIESVDLFKKILAQETATASDPAEVLQRITVVGGDITKFSTHGASAIVNAANMEVRMGGGVAGAIRRASERGDEIDAEGQTIVKAMNRN
jgi:O-acetyl-ADP-ribose deacetylase (regulator of RNase III)